MTLMHIAKVTYGKVTEFNQNMTDLYSKCQKLSLSFYSNTHYSNERMLTQTLTTSFSFTNRHAYKIYSNTIVARTTC